MYGCEHCPGDGDDFDFVDILTDTNPKVTPEALAEIGELLMSTLDDSFLQQAWVKQGQITINRTDFPDVFISLLHKFSFRLDFASALAEFDTPYSPRDAILAIFMHEKPADDCYVVQIGFLQKLSNNIWFKSDPCGGFQHIEDNNRLLGLVFVKANPAYGLK